MRKRLSAAVLVPRTAHRIVEGCHLELNASGEDVFQSEDGELQSEVSKAFESYLN